MREHLHVDPGRVHVLQPRLAGVLKLLHNMRRRGRVEPGEQRVEFAVGVMLFQRDDRYVRLFQQGISPFGWERFYGMAPRPARSLATCAISSAFTVCPMPG